jgi:hypothetical protein
MGTKTILFSDKIKLILILTILLIFGSGKGKSKRGTLRIRRKKGRIHAFNQTITGILSGKVNCQSC